MLPEGAVISDYGPSVWAGRALQAENDDLEKGSLAPLGGCITVARRPLRCGAATLVFATRIATGLPSKGED